MKKKDAIKKIQSELQAGVKFTKCKKCGCMKGTLVTLLYSLQPIENSSVLFKKIEGWLKEMEPTEYDCLRCEYCYPAMAMNILNKLLKTQAQVKSCL